MDDMILFDLSETPEQKIVFCVKKTSLTNYLLSEMISLKDKLSLLEFDIRSGKTSFDFDDHGVMEFQDAKSLVFNILINTSIGHCSLYARKNEIEKLKLFLENEDEE